MLTRRTVLWAKRETTYGTDPAMTGTDALLAYDVDFQPAGEVIERPVLRDTLSPIAHVIGLKEQSLTFKTELKGIGGVGATVGLSGFESDDLLSGVGFNTGVYNGTATIYSLVSAENSLGSVSFRLYMDDANLHKMVGARGTVKLNMKAGNYGELEWNFKGLYVSVASATNPSQTSLTILQPPIVYNSSFQIAGFSPVCSAAEIDLGNDIIRRDSLNASAGVHSFRLTGRKPKLSFDADAVAESSNPFWGDWEGGIVDTFGITIGSTANNKIDISGYFEYAQNKYGDADGVRKFDCEAALVSSNVNTGNDELTIKFS